MCATHPGYYAIAFPHIPRYTYPMSRVTRIHNRRQIEQAFLNTFEMIGGVDRLTRWADDPDNYALFLKYLLAFAPKEQQQDIEGQVLQYHSNVPQSPLNRITHDSTEHIPSTGT